MSKKLPFFEAISVLVGTIIGAGILGIPYVVAKSGFITGLVVLVVIALVMILVNLFLGEIVLSTKHRHQLTGYANKYLGPVGKYLMFGATVFGFYGALLAYIIGEGEVLSALTGYSPFLFSLLFFAFGSILVYLGLSVIKKFELIMTIIILLIVVLIGLWSFNLINIEHLFEFNLVKLFIPYGVIFFAIGGASAIPELRFALKGKEKLVKKSVIIGITIPFIVYFIFTLVVVGVTGWQTTEVATIGLGEIVGRAMIVFGNLFAFFTMGTSFLTLGLALKNTYQFDIGLGHKIAWVLACFPPLIVFLLGLNSFVKVLGLVGAIGGGIEGLLILAIYYKLKKLKKPERKPEYKIPAPMPIITILSLIFIGGIIFTLIYL